MDKGRLTDAWNKISKYKKINNPLLNYIKGFIFDKFDFYEKKRPIFLTDVLCLKNKI